jgi:hypothetical protein
MSALKVGDRVRADEAAMRDLEGYVPVGTEGTVLDADEHNDGRSMYVEWDAGQCDRRWYVSADIVTIINTNNEGN